MILHDVFISYKSQYLNIVKAVSHLLEEEGIRCWYAPRDLDKEFAGKAYDDAIFSAISACRVVVLILSDEALESYWVKMEITDAQHKNKLIIPYVAGKVTRENGLWSRLQGIHWIDAYPDPERKFSLLVRNVKTVLNQSTGGDDGQPGSKKPFPILSDDHDADFDLEEGEVLYQAKEYNDAAVALAASAERGNPKARQLICRLFYELDRRIEQISEDTWELLENQAKAGHCYACFAMHTKYYRDYENYYISFEYLKKAVREQNLGYAFLRLGIHHGWGMGVEQKDVLALHYYEKAIKLGCVEAYFYLGQQYEFGNENLTSDKVKAEEYYRKGAESDDIRALLKLGDFYAWADDAWKDKEKGFACYQRLIELGDYRGYSHMGTYYQSEGDQQEAVKYFKKAALHDVGDAFSSLAGICWNNDEKEDAYRWAKCGYVARDVFSAFVLGYFYETDGDYAKAWECYFSRYEWSGMSAEDLARLYIDKEYRPEKIGLDDIIRMLDIAARGRNEEAINRLIEIYRSDKFGSKDSAKAEAYKKMGAAAEMADQMYDYGIKLMNGDETTFNPYKGLEMIEKAARKKKEQAVEFLIRTYKSGPHEDADKCREWCRFGLDANLLDRVLHALALYIVLRDHFDATAELTDEELGDYSNKARKILSTQRNDGLPLRQIAYRLDADFDPGQVENEAITEGEAFETYYDYFWAYDMDMRFVKRDGTEFWDVLRQDKSYSEVITRRPDELGLDQFWNNPNEFFDTYEELCRRYSIVACTYTRIEPQEVLPYVQGGVAERFGRDVVRCMITLFRSGNEDIIKCRQPISDEKLLEVAERCKDDVVQLLLISYAEIRIEVSAIFDFYKTMYWQENLLIVPDAVDWLNDYRQRLTQLGIDHDIAPFEVDGNDMRQQTKPKPELMADAPRTQEDDEFDRLLDEFIARELGKEDEAPIS